LATGIVFFFFFFLLTASIHFLHSAPRAGFDAHDDDPLADVELIDEDFTWITATILASCARLTALSGSEVRYLSVLEGGYDVPAIQRCAVVHVEEMLKGLPVLPATPVLLTKQEEGPAEGSEVVQEGEGRGAVEKEDGELVALREYLEAFGVTDTKP